MAYKQKQPLFFFFKGGGGGGAPILDPPLVMSWFSLSETRQGWIFGLLNIPRFAPTYMYINVCICLFVYFCKHTAYYISISSINKVNIFTRVASKIKVRGGDGVSFQPKKNCGSIPNSLIWFLKIVWSPECQ